MLNVVRLGSLKDVDDGIQYMQKIISLHQLLPAYDIAFDLASSGSSTNNNGPN